MRVAGGQTQQKTEIWKHDQVSQSKELHTLQEKRSFSWRITFLPNYKDLYPQEAYNTQCRKAERQNGLRGDFSKDQFRSRDNGEAAG